MSENILLVEEGLNLKKEIIVPLKKSDMKITLLTEYGTNDDIYDLVITMDLSQWPKLSKELEQINSEKKFTAVLGLNEPSTGLVNDISKLLDLPIISRYSSDSFRHKDRMRIATEAYGINTPKYKIIEHYEELFKLSKWKFPLIVKPVSYMASIGAKKVNSFKELIEYAPKLFSLKFPIIINDTIHELGSVHNFSNKVIVEEFIDGQEYSVEGFAVRGNYYTLGVTHKVTTDSGYIDEVGHIFPAEMDENLRCQIYDFSEKIHIALGLENTLSHLEMKINEKGELYLIELGARMGGDFIHRLMRYYFSSFNIAELNLMVRKNNIDIKEFKAIDPNNYIGIVFFKISKEYEGKIVKSIKIKDIDNPYIKVLEKELFFEPGDEIQRTVDWGIERAGFVIIESTNFKEVSDFVNKANSNIEIEVL